MATLNVVGYTQRDNGSWVKVNGTLTYSVSSTDTSYTITLSSITSGTSSTSFTTYFKIVAGGTQIARVSFSSTGVKTINVSGTKTIQKTHVTQTVALTMTNELAFKSNSTSSGQGPSATANLSIQPKTSYTVLYNTQGGSSVSSQTKWHGENLTLSTTVPTKNGYLFKHWTDGTNVYASGATYSANVSLSLTAVWYSLCVLEDYDVYRCRYADPSTPEDEGRSAFFTSTLRYDPDLLFSGGTYSSSMGMEATIRVTDSNNMTTVYTQNGIPSGGTTGPDGYKRVPFTKLLGSSADNSFSTDETFQVSIEIKTKPLSSTGYSNQTMTYIATIPVAFFTMDVLAGGHGIAFGGPSNENAFVNYFKSKFLADVMFETMTGTIQMFGGTTPPNGWLLCDGSYVSKATYSKLWDVIGYTYGSSDSVPDGYFALPDLRGRMPIGPMDGSWVKNASNKNLIIDGYRISYVTDAYLAYVLPMWKDMTVNTTYTIQLWDVLIRNSGKDKTNIGINVFWGGGIVKLAEWLGESYFSPLPNFWHTTKTDTEGLMMYYAPYLEATFTTGSTAGANPGRLNIYNSMPNVNAERFMRVGRFQLTEGTHPKEPFMPYPQYRNKPLGSTGGETSPGFSVDNLPSHTHTIAHTHYLTSDKKQAWIAKAGTGATEPGGGISGSGKYYAAANATGYAWIDITAGSNTANSGGTGGNINPDHMPPYTAVNFIICTGVLN